MTDHHTMKAWALCWPNDPDPLLYTTWEKAEENRKWFASNFKSTRDGKPRGEPFLVELTATKGD